jgi:hypothetical protein
MAAATDTPSMPVVLFTVADAMARGALPLPVSVEVSDRAGLELSFATHGELVPWAKRMRLTVEPWHSQPYDRGETRQVLTNVYGRWRGIRVRLHCCEPVTCAPADLVAAVT